MNSALRAHLLRRFNLYIFARRSISFALLAASKVEQSRPYILRRDRFTLLNQLLLSMNCAVKA